MKIIIGDKEFEIDELNVPKEYICSPTRNKEICLPDIFIDKKTGKTIYVNGKKK